MRTALARSLLLVSSVLFGVAILEAALHLAPSYRPNPPTYPGEHRSRTSDHFLADGVIGWRMRPHHMFNWTIEGITSSYRSNGDGFRSDREFSAADPAPKIVVAGDSFTFGSFVNYSDTFGARIEDALPGNLVYNVAMPGYGIDQIWMSVRHVALPLRPSLVVVGFIDEDFERSLSAFRPVEGLNKPAFVLDNGGLRARTPGDTPNRFIRARDRYSWTWSLLHRRLLSLARYLPHGDWWALNAALIAQITRDLDADPERRGLPKIRIRPSGRG